MDWIKAPRTKDGEDVFGYAYDEDVADRSRVRLPLLRSPRTGRSKKADPGLLLADALILPRDHDKKVRPRLEELQALGAPEVPMPSGAATSFMSLNRHVVVPQWDKKKGSPSVREQLDAELMKRKLVIYVDRRQDEPMRVAVVPPFTSSDLSEMFRRAGYASKAKYPKRPVFRSVSLLTETSKMGCYSFNLPAGPRAVGGTCPAAGIGFMYSTVGSLIKSQAGKRDKQVMIDPERFICNGCYAMKGAYGNPSTIAGMQVRYVLVRALLKGKAKNVYWISAEQFEKFAKENKSRQPQDFKNRLQPARLTFSMLMIEAIKEARDRVADRRATLEAFGYTTSEYQRTEEILNWLLVRKKIRSLVTTLGKPGAKADNVQAEINTLLDHSGMTMDEALAARPKHKKVFSDWQLPDPDYFRIHDAGDMFSETYFSEWLKVCEYFSDKPDRVMFWAPTRMWAFAGGLKDDTLRRIPDNLAMRPSTLHFRDEAPSRVYLHNLMKLPRFGKGKGGGLSAPSGSAPEKPSEQDFKCPAYEHWSTGAGGAIRLDPRTQKGVGGTCITARGPNREKSCRACWTYNDLVVFYEEH